MFHWKDIHHSETLAVQTYQALIVDKDNLVHSLTMEPTVTQHDLGGNRIPLRVAYSADSRIRIDLESNEYVKTDAGLLIPRCNIKHITIKQHDLIDITKSWVERGIPHWDSFDWFMAFLSPIFLSVMVLAIAGIISKLHSAIHG